MTKNSSRIKLLRKKMSESNTRAFLSASPVNVNYVSNFSGGDSFLLVTPDKAFLLTDSRYTEQAREELINGVRIVLTKPNITEVLTNLVKKLHIKEIAFESESFTHGQFLRLQKGVKKVKFTPKANFIETLRQVKDADEIKSLRLAIDSARDGYFALLKKLRAGVTEEQMATDLEYLTYKHGARPGSFWSIVGINERAALPHAPLTRKKLPAKCLLLFDWGGAVNFYCSDTTRTIFLGKPDPLMKKIYTIVYDAQMKAIEKTRPGVKASELDFAARSLITKAGYGRNFGHSLGHGIGMQVHEMPAMNAKSTAVLEPGMVFTVEPGIYIPGKGGVRIEDMVLVTEKGYEVLSESIPKKIEDVCVKI